MKHVFLCVVVKALSLQSADSDNTGSASSVNEDGDSVDDRSSTVNVAASAECDPVGDMPVIRKGSTTRLVQLSSDEEQVRWKYCVFCVMCIV